MKRSLFILLGVFSLVLVAPTTPLALAALPADNGAEHYAYERIRNHSHRSFCPLRGLKRDLHEGGHRVPFIVRWPRVMGPGSVSGALVSQVDLMATLAAAVDYELLNRGTKRRPISPISITGTSGGNIDRPAAPPARAEQEKAKKGKKK